MYHPTTRVLTVLELLQTYGRISSAELARRLEVTPRSVRRYIAMLQDLGIPVKSERGRHGGYRLLPGYKLPPLMLTNEEALAVTLGLHSAERLGLSTGKPAIEGARAKIERVLPDSVRSQLNAVQDAMVLDNAPRLDTAQADTVMTISEAVQHCRRVWIRYGGPRGETSRTVDPYGLVFRDGRWYLVGRCHLRADVRIFRLDRIMKLRRLSSAFTRPEQFNAREYVVRTLERHFEDAEVELLLETSIEEARYWVPRIMGNLEETPDGVRLTSNTGSLEWMAYFIIGLPCPVTVRKPAELMERLHQYVARVNAIEYQPAGSREEAEPARGRRLARPA